MNMIYVGLMGLCVDICGFIYHTSGAFNSGFNWQFDEYFFNHQTVLRRHYGNIYENFWPICQVNVHQSDC